MSDGQENVLYEARFVVEVSEPVAAVEVGAVADRIALQLRMDPARVLKLLDGRTGPVTKPVLRDKADIIAAAFEDAGVVVVVRDAEVPDAAEPRDPGPRDPAARDPAPQGGEPQQSAGSQDAASRDRSSQGTSLLDPSSREPERHLAPAAESDPSTDGLGTPTRDQAAAPERAARAAPYAPAPSTSDSSHTHPSSADPGATHPGATETGPARPSTTHPDPPAPTSSVPSSTPVPRTGLRSSPVSWGTHTATGSNAPETTAAGPGGAGEGGAREGGAREGGAGEGGAAASGADPTPASAFLSSTRWVPSPHEDLGFSPEDLERDFDDFPDEPPPPGAMPASAADRGFYRSQRREERPGLRSFLLVGLVIALVLFLVLQTMNRNRDSRIPEAATVAMGFEAYRVGAFERADRIWRPLANAGDAEAQFMLGYMAQQGQGRPWSNREAAAWYERAAQLGDPRAQLELGLLYLRGMGVERDAVRAAGWIHAAAEAGFAEAQYQYALRLFQGEGVARDFLAAQRWFNAANAGGVTEAAAYVDFLRGAGPVAAEVADTGPVVVDVRESGTLATDGLETVSAP